MLLRNFLTFVIARGEVQNFAGFYRGEEDETKVEGNFLAYMNMCSKLVNEDTNPFL